MSKEPSRWAQNTYIHVMAEAKEFCATHGSVEASSVEMIGKTPVHTRLPWHRLIDGAVLVLTENDEPSRDDDGEPIVRITAPDAGPLTDTDQDLA